MVRFFARFAAYLVCEQRNRSTAVSERRGFDGDSDFVVAARDLRRKYGKRLSFLARILVHWRSCSRCPYCHINEPSE